MLRNLWSSTNCTQNRDIWTKRNPHFMPQIIQDFIRISLIKKMLQIELNLIAQTIISKKGSLEMGNRLLKTKKIMTHSAPNAIWKALGFKSLTVYFPVIQNKIYFRKAKNTTTTTRLLENWDSLSLHQSKKWIYKKIRREMNLPKSLIATAPKVSQKEWVSIVTLGGYLSTARSTTVSKKKREKVPKGLFPRIREVSSQKLKDMAAKNSLRWN